MTTFATESTPSPPPPPAAAVDAPPVAGRSPSAWVWFAGIASGVLVLDLTVKAWSFARVAGGPLDVHQYVGGPGLPPHDPVVVVPYVLNLQLVLNEGAVFGVLPGARWFFIVITVIAVAVVMRLFWKSSRRAWPIHVALALILGGAAGNLYDRVVYTVVRDMLHMLPGVHLPFGLSWGTRDTEVWPWRFNVADAALMMGVGGMLLVTFWHELRPPPPSRETGPG